MGPTGTGKTDLALDLFDKGSYRLINVDSVQIYKGLDIGKSGLQINRYKGLGEMNPDQLWETTLDQNERVLLSVKINEVDTANKAFEDLMGGETDARKRFIAENSLKVANLDI